MKKCKFNGCNRDHAAKGYCKTHYTQLWNKRPITKIKKVEAIIPGTKCKADGCTRLCAAKGYCKAHHRQWKQNRSTKEIRKTVLGQIGCKICDNKHWAKGYCRRHYDQKTRSGYARKYFVTNPNKFTFKDNICEIELYDKDGNVKAKAIIDKDDYEKCKNIKWGLQSGRCQYVKNVKAGFLHHHIWGKKVQLDHINRDKLDCRKSNLREATCQQNAQNRGMMSNNTSGITGVRWSKRLQKWRVQIFINGKNKHLGLFHDKNDAITARNNAVKKYHRSFGLTLER